MPPPDAHVSTSIWDDDNGVKQNQSDIAHCCHPFARSLNDVNLG